MRTKGTKQRERERLTARVRTESTEQRETDNGSENKKYKAERERLTARVRTEGTEQGK